MTSSCRPRPARSTRPTTTSSCGAGPATSIPNALLQIFKCDAIGSSSDSQYCNPEFDALYEEQLDATTNEERKTILAEMQNLIYDEAPYDILYYDANLDAYRTDRFAGWQNQPTANGTPMFTYSTLGYTLLTDVAAATPEPTGAAPSGSAAPGETAGPTPAASGDGGTPAPAADNTPLILGVGALIVIVAAGILFSRRRKSAVDDDEDD